MTVDRIKPPDPPQQQERTMAPPEACAMLARLAADVGSGTYELVCVDKVTESIQAGSAGGWRQDQRQDKYFILVRTKRPK